MAAFLLLLVLATAACGPIRSFRDDLLRTPPYQRYVASLRDAGLDRTPLGHAWIAEGERALDTPRAVAIPSRGAERFRPDSPSAFAYRVELRRGQTYRLALEPAGSSLVHVFVDVFRVSPGAPPQRVAGLGPPSRQLAFEPTDDDTFVVRIQPEFLASGEISVAHMRRAALLFPVPGAGRRNVQSLFGASRSSGRREHQGIDIFAPRGTPAVAAADGWISSTSPNELGGNVVWLWDPARGHTLYYAHLDRRAVSPGQRVRKGDVVGFIDPLYYVVDPPS